MKAQSRLKVNFKRYRPSEESERTSDLLCCHTSNPIMHFLLFYSPQPRLCPFGFGHQSVYSLLLLNIRNWPVNYGADH